MPQTARLDTKLSIRDYLSDFVKDKTVLDVGCVAHFATEEQSKFWLHRRLVESAKSVLGIDIVEAEVEQLRKKGYNMVCADAMTASLDETFEVIVAGEVIEHVPNPGAMLVNLKRHLKSGGRLVLTTPNPFFFLNTLVPMFSWQKKFWHPDHVSWICPYTMTSMLRKAGLEVESCHYFTVSRRLRRLLRTLHLPSFGFLSTSYVVVARVADENRT